ncbi:dehydrogenase [Sphingobacterium mizutaii NBRC 14946 = DSM 11724]|uniref:Inositol 2-dehydrogenase n=2 Tax=Sphingobacterium mizutaii TaxID=1010 RepID=A0AAJ4XB54_9SPHI|nr:Gfo/Idh/MocA family oxidoreductase [Sphingobacterium mizutaii]GEM68715.1 dehydrogenase [Sphingobacterium mizutaii NBRC 14946 = DSM 11724]SDK87072.1 Oxidoreductase family, NAD-binding Rossmann fold [Sphingobacterium mizutaii]SNV45936.1 Inositol 2-dehydrogenase [Sphingobacterium mizutaii]
MNHHFSRRSFLKKSIIAGGALTMASSPLGNILMAKPNERVNLAAIGIGNRGGEILMDLYKTGLCNIVALCDVDMGAKHTEAAIKQFPDVPRFQDFRQMFDKMGNQIDAVTVGVPDFSHFPITMMALDLGKHVYVEKPMARTFLEVELMMEKARKNPKLATQMGNQGHSDANYFQYKAWTEAGIIKDVTQIVGHMNMPRRWHGWDVNIKNFPPAEPIPSTIDWDLWQMQTIGHNYNKDFINGQWRCWFDFGMGALGDWGAHILDTSHEFLKLGLPTEVGAEMLEGHNSFFFPMSSTLKFSFPKRKGMPALDIMWYDGINNLPPIPEGYGVSGLDPNIPPPSTGNLEPAKLNPGKIIYGKDLTFKGGSHGSTLSIIPEQKAKDIANKLPVVPESPSNHFANFLKACKGEEKTRSPFEIAGPLSQVFCLGVIAQRLNGKFKFDPVKKEITNDKFANALLIGPPPRTGFEQYYKV